MYAIFVSPHFLHPNLSRPPNASITLYSSSVTHLRPSPDAQLSPSPLSMALSEPAEPISVKTQQKRTSKIGTGVGSTDWIASTLTRRFGVGAGLAWAAFLAVGVVSEQIKTRLEVSQQEANTRDVETAEVVLPNGIRYNELREGGGASPRRGDLVVIELKGKLQDSSEVFVDTLGGGGDKKPLALVMGSRPYSRGMCEGIENMLRSMKAGGKRRVIVPPDLGYGEKGADFGVGVRIPPYATLEYVVELDKVSIAPA